MSFNHHNEISLTLHIYNIQIKTQAMYYLYLFSLLISSTPYSSLPGWLVFLENYSVEGCCFGNGLFRDLPQLSWTVLWGFSPMKVYTLCKRNSMSTIQDSCGKSLRWSGSSIPLWINCSSSIAMYISAWQLCHLTKSVCTNCTNAWAAFCHAQVFTSVAFVYNLLPQYQ